MATTQKPLVFISHITEEKEIALAFKRLIETTFLNMIDVFVSSDPTSIKLGRKWLDEITHALKSCAIEIILASPESVKRPWINFEGGCAWIREIPVIPLCHSGMIPTKLPQPLHALQAATVTEEAQLKLVFPLLADAIGCTMPAVDYTDFIEAVKKFEGESRAIKQLVEETPVAANGGLTSHELATLVEVAEQTFVAGEAVATGIVRNALEQAGHTGIAAALALKMLARKDLIELSSEADGYDEYTAAKVSDEGWIWLEANQNKLVLTRQVSQVVPGDAQASDGQGDDIPF